MSEVKITNRRKPVVELMKQSGLTGVVSKSDIDKMCSENSVNFPHWIKELPKPGYGLYDLSPLFPELKMESVMEVEAETEVDEDEELDFKLPNIAKLKGDEFTYVPNRFKGYVAFGHFSDVKKILGTGKFYPMYITGLSGNGKTIMVQEICARLGRELVRANVTGETDEDDLIGGFRLVDGETRWQDGPVITAMKRGAVLLLDEVDLGTPKLMCLQPVLEGSSVYVKKINQVIHPAPGFTVVATANTKGKGSDNGMFVGTMVMNEAFLERFAITFEQDYPNEAIEAKILNKQLEKENLKAPEFVENLCRWAATIREGFNTNQQDDIISTRRLVHVITAYSIFDENREKAITLALSRFSEETKDAFLDLYSKIDKEIEEERERKRQEEALIAQGVDPEEIRRKKEEAEKAAESDDFPF